MPPTTQKSKSSTLHRDGPATLWSMSLTKRGERDGVLLAVKSVLRPSEPAAGRDFRQNTLARNDWSRTSRKASFDHFLPTRRDHARHKSKKRPHKNLWTVGKFALSYFFRARLGWGLAWTCLTGKNCTELAKKTKQSIREVLSNLWIGKLWEGRRLFFQSERRRFDMMMEQFRYL